MTETRTKEEDVVAPDSPTQRVAAAFLEVFSLIRLPQETQKAIMAVLLTQNGSAIFEGIPGTGKTTLVEILGKTFGLKVVKVTCAPQKVTLEGTAYRLSIPDLIQKGEENLLWKKFMDADLLFISEFNRAPQSFQDELIDLMQYRELEAYSEIKQLPPHAIMMFDQNPYRGGLDKAIADRPLAAITFPRVAFWHRLKMTLERYNTQTNRDLRQDAQQKATLDDLLECQAQVDAIEIPQDAAFLASILTESLSSCLYPRDQANRKYVPPCMSASLKKLGRKKIEADDEQSAYLGRQKQEELPCEFLGDICSCVKEPMSYRIDESLVLLAKASAFIETAAQRRSSHDRFKVLQEDIVFAFKYVVGNRLELRDSIAKNWANSQEWITKEFFPYVNQRKIPAWVEAIKHFQQLSNGKPKDPQARLKLKTIAAKNHEVRPLAEAVGITDFQTTSSQLD